MWIVWSWVSSVLINLGSALILFSPLYWLTERLAVKVRKLNTEVVTAQREVGATQAKLQNVEDFINPALPTDFPNKSDARSEAAAKLDQNVQQEMGASRRNDEELYSSIALEPDPVRIAVALLRAEADDLITSDGPRCELLYSDYHVRFVAVWIDDIADLKLTIETDDGTVLFAIPWSKDETATSIFARIGELLRDSPGFPGEELFFAGQLPLQLSDLLLYASRYRPSVTGSMAIRKIVEILQSGWVITERYLLPKSYRDYTIDVSRLNELDWPEHIRNKGWKESFSFEEALNVARGLKAFPRTKPSSQAEE
jgi:hypothetical protein